MSHPRLCCCDEAVPATCGDSCDFLTEYTMTSLAGGISYFAERNFSVNDCGIGGTEDDHHNTAIMGGRNSLQVNYSVGWALVGSPVLTRDDGPIGSTTCCYLCTGQVLLSCELAHEEVWVMCLPCVGTPIDPFPFVCFFSDSVTWSETVDFCYAIACVDVRVATCSRATPGTGSVWRHTLHIDRHTPNAETVRLSGLIWSGWPAPFDPCAPQCDEDDIPLSIGNLVCQWETELVAPDDLPTGTGSFIGFCHYGGAEDTANCTGVEACTESQDSGGPFSIAGAELGDVTWVMFPAHLAGTYCNPCGSFQNYPAIGVNREFATSANLPTFAP